MNANRAKETKERKAAVGRRRRFVPTARDLEIVRWVQRAGVTTREQVQALFFKEGGRSRSALRLTLLYRHRYLDRLQGRAANTPDVYVISRRSVNGLRFLRAVGAGETPRVRSFGPGRLQHQLAIASCRVQLTLACEQTGILLLRWLDEDCLRPLLIGDGILPDAFFHILRLTDQGERHAGFLLEVERSDKSDRALREKFRRLGAFYYDDNGARYEQRFGLRALRLLFLLDETYGIRPERRIEKLAALAAELNVTFLRFAPLEAFLAARPRDLLTAPIWSEPSVAAKRALFGGPKGNGD